VVVNTLSANQTLTVTNSGAVNLAGIGVTLAAPFSRNGGTCGTTLNAGASCTILIRFAPTATGAATGSVTITGSFAITGSPVSLTGNGLAAPTLPTLTVLDNFNRANANTLGANWQQLVALGAAGIRVNTNQAFCTGLLCAVSANAYWSPATFGAKQGAAFTISNTPFAGDSLVLAGSGALTLGVYTNYIRVRVTGASALAIETTTNLGVNFTSAATFAGTFASGSTITAVLDGTNAVAAPTVYVWNGTTFVGAVQIQPDALWQGGGRIGMQIPNSTRVDNFAGGTVP
jgi:hypothetical protein